jgi:hypothetical protein
MNEKERRKLNEQRIRRIEGEANGNGFSNIEPQQPSFDISDVEPGSEWSKKWEPRIEPIDPFKNGSTAEPWSGIQTEKSRPDTFLRRLYDFVTGASKRRDE